MLRGQGTAVREPCAHPVLARQSPEEWLGVLAQRPGNTHKCDARFPAPP